MAREDAIAIVRVGLSAEVDPIAYWSEVKLVEAAGVEPASEIHVSRETPCVVEFRRFRTTRSEPTRCA